MNNSDQSKSKVRLIACVLLLAAFLCSPVFASSDKILDTIPVKEVTIFKDGHAFILHQGQMPTDDNGNVTFDKLPSPVLGTFWAYSADRNVELNSVLVGKKLTCQSDTALTIPELIKANAGKRVLINQNNLSYDYEAVILQLPSRKPDEQANNQPTNSFITADIVLLKTIEGTKAVPINNIREITFIDEPNTTTKFEKYKNTMTFKLNWKNNSRKTADVGMVYLQKGLRWIPNYKVDIDGNGNARIKLQATIVNELTDIEDVTAHLVIGVPTFAFKDSLDPIALDETVAELSSHFRRRNETAYAFDNAIRSQVTNYDYAEMPAQPQPDSGPEVLGSEKNEDLFVFTLENLTFKKGQRIVVPIAEYEIEYIDIYKLELPLAPPSEIRRNFNSSQHIQIEKLLHQPSVKHCLRLQNDTEYPLTTAPALILRNGKLISQALMTYTAVGGKCDLEMSTAVDVFVKCLEKQTQYTPNAMNINGNSYSKIDMTGSVELKNHKKQNIKIEVKRFVLGHIDQANLDAEISQLGHGYGSWFSNGDLPFWWNWCSWPWWWYHVNSLGQISWDIEVEANEKIELQYSWHYFWH